MANEHTQQAGQICRPRQDSKLEHLAWESRWETWTVLQDLEKAYNLKNFATRGNKKSGVGISTEGLRRPQNH